MIEIISDPRIHKVVFDVPILVRISHQIGELDGSNLSVVIARPLPLGLGFKV